MKKIQYRQRAKLHFREAESILEQGDANKVLYAVLRLRMVIECLAYELLQSMLKDLVGENVKTWQPGKLMKELQEIDPTIEQSRTISVGVEDASGVAAKRMECLGTDKRLTGAWVTKQWQTLGSYLHEPTMAQSEQGKRFDDIAAKEKLLRIKEEIQEVLSSQLFAVNIRETYSFNCECGERISRGSDAIQKYGNIACSNCERIWSVVPVQDGFKLGPFFHNVTCPKCRNVNKYDALIIKEERVYTCQNCDAKISIVKDWCPRLIG
ncbi:MAG: hypothetical protein JJU42_16855 [Rhodobacteraceae bacterium]|nr:hypothetical protein [Paracoccaceae bacterium]